MNRRDFFANTTAAGLGLSLNAAAQKPAEKNPPAIRHLRLLLPQGAGVQTMTYADLVRLAADLNVDGLDLTVYWFPDATARVPDAAEAAAYRQRDRIYSISIRTECCRRRGAAGERSRGISGWVDVAEKLGARPYPRLWRPRPQGLTEDQAAGWVVEVLKRAADYAGRRA